MTGPRGALFFTSELSLHFRQGVHVDGGGGIAFVVGRRILSKRKIEIESLANEQLRLKAGELVIKGPGPKRARFGRLGPLPSSAGFGVKVCKWAPLGPNPHK